MIKKVSANKNDNEKTALLVMDIQTAIIDMVKDSAVLIKNIQTAIHAAHTAKIPVFFVKVSFRPGFPEVSPNNKSFSAIKQNKNLFKDATAMDLYPALKPKQEDIIVSKKRVSAFVGSDLEVILRSMQINHLVLCGIATSGVVLSTLREAADKDYQLTVLADCCADGDPEVHTVLLSKVFPRQADVMDTHSWSKTIE